MRPTLVLACLVLAGALAASFAGSSAQQPTRRAVVASLASDRPLPSPSAVPGPVAAEVSIANADYLPASVTIREGEAVRWVHRDGTAAHNVFGDDGSFRSAIGNAGLVFVHTFGASGTYTYRCSIHPFMTGAVNVLP